MLPKKLLSACLNARTEGSGRETIVLAHGYGTDQTIWDKVTPFFAENYKVVLFDWPFSGAVVKDDDDESLYDPLKYSCMDAFADDLITLMSEMNLKDANFVGHSMSGMVGCLASIKRPDLFKRLILVGASPRYMNIDEYKGGFTSSDIEMLLGSIESNYETWVYAFSSLVVDPNDKPSVNKFRECLQNMGSEVALSLANTVFCSDYRDILDKVETPCTIIQMSNDIVVPQSVAHYMEKNIRGKVTLEVIETHGHFPQLTAHLEFVKVLNGVLGFGITQI